MNELHIASKPLITLTLRSYEANQAALKICRSMERDVLKRQELDKEIGELEKMIAHTCNVLNSFE